MTDDQLTVKELIKKSLTEDFTKENNKIFSMSKQSFKNFRTLKKYLSSFQFKDSKGLSSTLSENVILLADGIEFNDRKDVIQKLISVIEDFNPNKFAFKHANNSIHLSMNIGEIRTECNDNADGSIFVIPWVYVFSCRVLLEFYEIEKILDLNHSVEFNQFGKISSIILHKM